MNRDDSELRKKMWQVTMSVDEERQRTRAVVEMRWRGNVLTGTGLARRNPADRDVPEIGDELAVARALSDLADQLFSMTACDINDITHEPTVIMH